MLQLFSWALLSCASPAEIVAAFVLLGLIFGFGIIIGIGRLFLGNECGPLGLPGNWPRPHLAGAAILAAAICLWVGGAIYLPAFLGACG